MRSIKVVLFVIAMVLMPSLGISSDVPRKYSLEDVLKVLNKQKTPVYMQVGELLAQVVYVSRAKKISIAVLPAPDGSTVNEPKIIDRPAALTGNFNATLIVESCGKVFGDDPCDQYSPIGLLRVGKQIGPDEKGIFDGYVQAIGKVFEKKKH